MLFIAGLNGKIYKVDSKEAALTLNEKHEPTYIKPLDFSITKNVFMILESDSEDEVEEPVNEFPVLQQNEEDTWYDQKGNIVFTCSKGLTGVGVDRSVWNGIKDLKDGETYEHTIEKSELYHGEKVTYFAPFEKCDRVEDYKVAWAHFEKIFNQN